MFRIVIPPPRTPGAFCYRNHTGDELKIVAASLDNARRALANLARQPDLWTLHAFRALIPAAVALPADPDVIHGATL